ncbi:hypothetical protein [Paenibacillus sacheonensis]|uniref:DUF5302 domain-containing protein n=1 Tax=Paenibacillus sacheonensis TaxID=742054 RepID=A0A7X4YN22_9BACL|nr:hypothetical protein [Paenibacillus sacheonensis]MBM7568257.1 hypothetical protein [Paenibacillus sacheonensis]NBC68556.1 hypothetical protein [Paenibacillus sacheonensis]
MSENQTTPESQEQELDQPKKVSLADAVKQKLAQKKLEQANGGKQKFGPGGNQQTMKSQNTKKVNNQRKKMGV